MMLAGAMSTWERHFIRKSTKNTKRCEDMEMVLRAAVEARTLLDHPRTTSGPKYFTVFSIDQSGRSRYDKSTK